MDEAWRKLTSRQFANDPARGLEEIISNAVDAYPNDIPREKVKIAIDFSENSVMVTDWGEGMSLNRIDCLLTLGGSDKSFDDKKIRANWRWVLQSVQPGTGNTTGGGYHPLRRIFRGTDLYR